MKPTFSLSLFLFLLLGVQACTDAPSSKEEAVISETDTLQVPVNQAPLRVSGPFLNPIDLTQVATTVLLSEIWPELAVDSVAAPPGIQAELKKADGALRLTIIGDPPALTVLKVWAGGENYDVLLRYQPSVKKSVTLRLRDDGYRSVAVKGAMNQWNAAAGKMYLQKNGVWEYTFEVAPGDYPYLFVADGKEMMDPKNPQKSADGKGGNFSLLSIPGPKSRGPAPVLTLQSVEGPRVSFRLSEPGAVLAFWENRLLLVSREEDVYTFSIPEEAASYSQSTLRVYGQNERGIAEALSIPLEGAAVSSSNH